MEKYETDGTAQFIIPNSMFRTVNINLSYKRYHHQEIEPGGIIGTEFGVFVVNLRDLC